MRKGRAGWQPAQHWSVQDYHSRQGSLPERERPDKGHSLGLTVTPMRKAKTKIGWGQLSLKPSRDWIKVTETLCV